MVSFVSINAAVTELSAFDFPPSLLTAFTCENTEDDIDALTSFLPKVRQKFAVNFHQLANILENI